MNGESATRIILTAHWRAARNGLRQETRQRVVWGIVFVVGLLVAIWSARSLAQHVAGWQAKGPGVLRQHLWLLCARAWTGFAMLAALSTLRLGFGEDEAALLLTLPLQPASRFRALLALLLAEGLGAPTVAFGVVMAATLGSLGWAALPWLVLSLAGSAAVACAAFVGTTLALCALAASGAPVLRAAQLAGMALAVAWAVVLAGWLPLAPPLPAPGLAAAVLVLGLAAVAGPPAAPCGRLYVAAYHTLQTRSGRVTPRTPPGVGWVAQWLVRWRSITGATMVKELLTQSRNPFNWARAIAVFAYLLLFPWVASYLAHTSPAHLTRTQLMVAYLSLVALVSLIDTAPSPFGGEGNRLILYLTTPLDFAALLRARLLAILVPLLLEGLALSLVLGWWLRVDPTALALVVLFVALITAGTTTLLVYGSIWDADLSLAIEGPAAALLHEQVPGTPRRIQLIGLCLLLLAALLLIAWKLPSPAALPLLALVDAVVLALTGQLGRMHLRALLCRE
jgi:hypothetical protein